MPLELIYLLQDDEVATSWLNNETVRKAIHAAGVRFLRIKILNQNQKFVNF